MTIHFNWTKEISVGNELLDRQHQKFLDQMNRILDAVVFGVESENVQNHMIEELEVYVREHFHDEEEYMKSIKYKDLKNHRQKHVAFIKKFLELKKQFNQGADRKALIKETETCMSDWWQEHICGEDQKYKVK